MGRYLVYHRKLPTFEVKLGLQTAKLVWDEAWPRGFDLVAAVRADGLERAFYLTNHVESDWTKNDDVKYVGPAEGSRSTSVGDVVVDPAGQAWRCEGCGWSKVETPEDVVVVM